MVVVRKAWKLSLFTSLTCGHRDVSVRERFPELAGHLHVLAPLARPVRIDNTALSWFCSFCHGAFLRFSGDFLGLFPVLHRNSSPVRNSGTVTSSGLVEVPPGSSGASIMASSGILRSFGIEIFKVPNGQQCYEGRQALYDLPGMYSEFMVARGTHRVWWVL